jgi:hypothetical protein
MARSAVATVILAPCFAASLFAGISIAAEILRISPRPYHLPVGQALFAAMIGATFGLLSSAWVTAIWWAADARFAMARDRTDLYYVKAD